MIFILQLFLFSIGLVFGSFIANLCYRYGKGISNLTGRSYCDHCKKPLKWFDNIPVFSYIILRGRSSCCNKKISARYPIVEFLTGVGFVLVGLNVISLILFCILEIIFIIDSLYQVIPDFYVFLGILIAILLPDIPLFSSLLAGLLASVSLLSIYLLTKGRGMGLGDVKFAVLGGMIVGLPYFLIWLLIAFLTGGIAGIILILRGSAGLKSKIAFGPFLVISIPITLLWGQKIIELMLLR